MMGGMPNASFPGITKPSINLQDVRDGRRSMPFYYPVDLSTARSIAAGTHLVLNVAGNSFYSDPLVDSAGLPVGGIAIVHFQDVTLNPQGTPFTVAPQFIARVPFTQIIIENPAQVGKSARFIYGMDIDFTPGINAQVSISGAVSTRSVGQNYGAKFASSAALAVGATETIWLPAANPNGAIAHAARILWVNGTAWSSTTSMHAHTAAPAAWTDGDVLCAAMDGGVIDGASRWGFGKLDVPLSVVSGKGAYFYNNGGTNETGARRSTLYTLS